MKNVNTFDKGLLSDLDYTKRPSGTWDFPTENVRVFNKRSQGFILTSMSGTEKRVELDSGYGIIGATSYKGFVFIVSYNPSTEKVQIGSFPSFANRGTTQISPSYSPLLNVKDGLGFIGFDVKGVGYHSRSELDMFVSEEYDNTFSLYVCDGQTINRIINTAFGVSGYAQDRYYNSTDVLSKTQQFLSSEQRPAITLDQISDNGVLEAGNYFLFIRYTTKSFDSTVFFSQIGPIQVAKGSNPINTEGGDIDENTGKSIKLSISNLDLSYSYFEIGVVRYGGDLNSGPDSAIPIDVYIIDSYYSTSSSEVTIYGTEGRRTYTLGEMLAANSSDISSKTHTQEGNRYWGANWKELGYDRAKLSEFAQLVTPYVITKELDDAIHSDYEPAMGGLFSQYNDYRDTLESRSHYRGEIYPYAVVFTFGSVETEAFPISGRDFAFPVNGAAPANQVGLVRMPLYTDGSDVSGVNNMSAALGLGFNITSLIGAVSNYTGIKPDGFYIVRGKRIRNILYQGYLAKAYNRVPISSSYAYFGENDFASAPISAEESRYIPLIGSSMPVVQVNVGGTYYTYIVPSASTEKFALLSPDYMFQIESEISDGGTYYVYDFMDPYLDTVSHSANISPTAALYEERKYNLVASSHQFANQTPVEVVVHNVEKDQYNAGGQFASKLSDGEDGANSNYGFYYDAAPTVTIWNRGIITPKYLGIVPNGTLTAGRKVNLCRFKDHGEYWNSTLASFTSSRTLYGKASGHILFEQSTPVTVETYAGDCFVQRTFFRAIHFMNIPDGHDGLGAGSNYYKFGYGLSMITENTLNTAMRSEVRWEDDTEVGEYTYYPRSLIHAPSGTITGFAALNTSDDYLEEAFYINPGYNKTGVDEYIIGFDPLIPYYNPHRKSRIRHSVYHEPFGFENGYRILKQANYVDADISGGAITCIRGMLGNLVAISEMKIQQYYINEKLVTAASSEGELSLGTGAIIHPTPRELAEFGCEKTNAIVYDGNSLFGMSLSQGVIWRISGKMSQAGSVYLVAEDLGSTTLNSQAIKHDIIEIAGGGYVNNIIDDQLLVACAGFNPAFGEVYFTLYKRGGKTFVFNSRLNMFIGTMGILPKLYANTDRFCFSFKSNNGWEHDARPDLNLHGVDQDITFSFVVNGLVGDNNDSLSVKIFESTEIELRKEDIVSVDFVTDTQVAQYVPSDKFWEGHQYYEGRLVMPIVRQDNVKGYIGYGPGSLVRGTWMLVTVRMKARESVYIRNAITEYKHSM